MHSLSPITYCLEFDSTHDRSWSWSPTLTPTQVIAAPRFKRIKAIPKGYGSQEQTLTSTPTVPYLGAIGVETLRVQAFLEYAGLDNEKRFSVS